MTSYLHHIRLVIPWTLILTLGHHPALSDTLIGADSPGLTIVDIIQGIGHQMCARECLLRHRGCNSISYDKVHYICRLRYRINDNTSNDTTSDSTITSNSTTSCANITSLDEEILEAVADKFSKIKFGTCADVVCAANEKCVVLTNSTLCVQHDMPRDCKDVVANGEDNTGMHVVYPFLPGTTPVPTICDADPTTDGYTTIHRRWDGSINFTRTWEQYKEGFGNLESEFWIGNDAIHALSTLGASTMYIKLEHFNTMTRFAKYTSFHVANETDKYKLTWAGYTGNGGNSLNNCNNAFFSTPERDHDLAAGNCAGVTQGGWWHKMCCYAQLNGLYCRTGAKCNIWFTFFSAHYGMKSSVMLIRRND